MLKQWLSLDFTLSKRLLGLVMVLVGVLGVIGILAFDAWRGGDFGPSQRLALGGCIAVLAVGITLIPLGGQAA